MITREPPAARIEKTAADYLAIALSPLLIMAMVGSLTFFLIEIGYEGDYPGRLRWTLFWFVFASVLVSRIAIENGSAYASLYGLALAGATGLLLYRYIGVHLGVWSCLALTWWSTSKLTWDCTLIEDDEDASGEGLLRVAGLDRSRGSSAIAASDDEHSFSSQEAHAGVRTPRAVRCWRALSQCGDHALPHTPGLWVVYFSLAALPVFGAGQLMIAEDKTASQFFGFSLLALYLASGLTLLLTTSFLGLRRYLRQRRVRMPGAIARSWIGLGLVVILGVLLLSLALPRPSAVYSLSPMVKKIGSPSQEPSFFHWGTEGVDSDENEGAERAGQFDRDGRPIREAPGAETSRTSPAHSFIPWEALGLAGPSGAADSMVARILILLKWLTYLLLAFVALWMLKRYAGKWANWMLEWIRAFWKIFAGWFIRLSTRPQIAAAQARVPSAARPFSSFTNPFTSGLAARWSSAELILYSFEALQSWAREQGSERRPDQTPFEFGRCLEGILPFVASDVGQFTHAYSRLAYAGRLSASLPLESMERLWDAMTRARSAH